MIYQLGLTFKKIERYIHTQKKEQRMYLVAYILKRVVQGVFNAAQLLIYSTLGFLLKILTLSSLTTQANGR